MQKEKTPNLSTPLNYQRPNKDLGFSLFYYEIFNFIFKVSIAII